MLGPSPLGTMDVVLFAISLKISVAIGLYFANKNKTLEEFMLGGRTQKLLPVSVSMMTSFISGLTIVGTPSELYYHGPNYATIVIGMLIWVPFSAFILLPVFYSLGSVSLYGYLENRYHKRVRQLVSILFMMQMTLYNAVVLYVPSLSLQSIFGISEAVSIGAVGVCCLLYSTVGGIKAVIWTDFFQAGLLYLSLLCVIFVGTIRAGGFMSLIETADAGGRLSFDGYWKLDLSSRHTFYTILFGTTLVNILMNGCNQIQVQRALSLPSLKQAQYSQLLCAIFTALVSLMGSYVGLILYQTYKDCDPYKSQRLDRMDAIVILYIYEQMDRIPGIRGVFVAGIFAATLSTLSSFQNSMSALLMEDLVRPSLHSRGKKDLSEAAATRLSKLFSFAFGCTCIGLTFVVGRISGLLQAAMTLFGALGGPFMAAFCLGMMTRFVNTAGILAGMLFGFAIGVYVQIYQLFYMPVPDVELELSVSGCFGFNSTNTPLTSASRSDIAIQGQADKLLDTIGTISYLWLPVFTLLLSMVVAIVVSIFTGGCGQSVEDRYLIEWLRRETKTSRGSAQTSGSST